jgi:predicted TIM-barrel fold metal-dependent hydrolase
LAIGDADAAAASAGVASAYTSSNQSSFKTTALQNGASRRTDCDFDTDVWDRGDHHGLAASGIGRVVMNRLPIASTASLSPQAGADSYAWRAVIGAPQDADKDTLQALHANGVRGIRFEISTVTSAGLDPMLKFADSIVPFGWHIELNVTSFGAYRALSKAEWSLMQFPVAVCFSGLSGFRQGRRADDADIGFLLGMMQLGRYWLKLTSDDLMPTQLKLWDEPSPLATALAGARKDRLIWGSGKQPTGEGSAYLSAGLAVLEKYIPHPADREAILIGNPATLYDF